MADRRNPLVGREGIPFMLAAAAAVVAGWHFFGFGYALLPLALLVYFYLIFRDPRRDVPAAPLGVVSPVDGFVVAAGVATSVEAAGETHKIILRINSWGTYTARCPVEGKIMDQNSENAGSASANGLWVRTDEGDDVILQFSGHRFGLAPQAFFQFGDRVGQGQRCAYLRMTRLAAVELPLAARILVKAGQRVKAGSDLIAKLPHH